MSTKEELIKKLKAAPLFTPINIPVTALTPCEYNPRTITEDKFQALVDSIKSDPDFIKARPLIINVRDGRTGIVIAGNQRLKAAIKLGWDKVPCLLVDVPESVEKKWNIKDNISSGEFEKQMLQEIVLELRDDNVNLNSIGFTPDELVDLVNLTPAIIDPSDDPENKGSTPKGKVKIAQGAQITCPNCNHTWKYAVGVESIDDNSDDKTD